jgi:hypothetical protein
MLSTANTSTMFSDRRKRNSPSKVPEAGCRRKGSRLAKNRPPVDEAWYLLTNYVDDK